MLIKDTMFNNSCVVNLATILSDVQQYLLFLLNYTEIVKP